MFWGRLWGFEQGNRAARWRVSKPITGIMLGVVFGIAWVVMKVINDEDGLRRGGWEWIDVVSVFRVADLIPGDLRHAG